MRTLRPARRLSLLCALAIAALGLARPVAGREEPRSPQRRAYRGEVALQPGGEAELVLRIGDRVRGETKIEAVDWFGGHAVSGQVTVTNPTDEKVHFGYHLAFFDAAGELLGCASQALDVDPKDSVVVGGAIVHLPPNAIEEIRRYQIAWYEDTAEIGKR